jgi:hypothetical protein
MRKAQPLVVALLMFVLVQIPVLGDDTCGKPPNNATNNIPYSMFVLSKPQDSAQCSTGLDGEGNVVFTRPVSNPAMTCPDMVAWALFSKAVRAEFWRNWAADQQTWPGVSCDPSDAKCIASKPLPLCTAGLDPSKCCDPAKRDNPGYSDVENKAKYCPYFPGDHIGPTDQAVPLRVGQLPSKAHLVSFAMEPRVQALLALEQEPGRKIRQAMAELVFRNKPMFDYTFKNNLYNQEGIMAVFRNHNAAQIAGAPYHADQSAPLLTEIDYPIESIMIKSNWISKDRAIELGLKEDPANPFVKMNIISPVTDNNGTILSPGEHWLVALHISSKDVPNWVWATFEHVNNPGRCDYTGCNDSFGYDSPDAAIKAGQARNYTAPKTKCDNLLLAGWVFDTAKTYDGGTRSAALTRIFQGLGIGKKDNTTLNPSYQDRAWLSYRLKGAQAQFTDSMGSPTRLGNSITEGGFVNTSSCMSCHARAGATSNGTQSLELGVFVNDLGEAGYFQSAHGVPNPDWFFHSGVPKKISVIQTDFIWGFLGANCVTEKCQPVAIGAEALTLGTETHKPTSVRSKVQDQ